VFDPLTIDVRTATGSYPVLLGGGLASRLGRILDQRKLSSRRILVSNPVVWRLHGELIARALPGAHVILVPDGERHKHLQTVTRIYEGLIAAEADRASVLVAVGGGVVGDMAGFAAATFLRGLTLVQVPTTLLAQVDASIGGKVGVNLAAGKNLVGSFYPPAAVITDPSLLATLPRREFRAGLYEVIKYGMACSATLFERLRRELPQVAGDDAALGGLIAECCRIKAHIVSADERESGLRRVLNFGHTAGHAIESVTGYRRFRHGEAVGWGMLVAAQLSVKRRVLAEADRVALRDLIMGLGPLPPIGDLSVNSLLEIMHRDKKVHDGRLHFVLPTALGASAVVDDVTAEELASALIATGFRQG
jgi:3-dehydroquinate synthase